MKTRLLSVDYLGFTAMDRRFSSAMLPWVLLEIRRRGTKEKLCLGLENGSLLAYDVNFELQFVHKLQNIMRFTQVTSNPTEFLYLVKDGKDSLLYCYLFQASAVEECAPRSRSTKMNPDSWARIYCTTQGTHGASMVTNFEFWTGALLIVLACELDFVYFHVLRFFAET